MASSGDNAREAVPDVASWARSALASLSRLPGVRRVGLALTEGGGRRLRFTATDRDRASAVDWCYVDAYDDVPLNTALRTGVPVLGALSDLDDRYTVFRDRQRDTSTVAIAAVPIEAVGRVLGGYVLFFDRAQPFGRQQRHQLIAAGRELGADLRVAQRSTQRRDGSPAVSPLVPGALVAAHEVPSDLAGVGDARAFLTDALRGWRVNEQHTETAVLCLSELVTNAVLHAVGGCVVRAVLEGQILTVTVRDEGVAAASPTSDPAPGPLVVHGRGLQLVDALATRWGSELDASGSTVWFVLEV